MGMSLKFCSEGFVVTKAGNLHGQVLARMTMTTAFTEPRDRIVNRGKDSLEVILGSCQRETVDYKTRVKPELPISDLRGRMGDPSDHQ